MNRFKLVVPKGIHYISDWKDFKLPEIPHIMNKIVTGCGFTEYFLRPNPKYPKIILVSPRKVLLENKEDQHNNPKDGVDIGKVYYARNEYDTVGDNTDIDLKEKKKLIKESSEKLFDSKAEKAIVDFKDNLNKYLLMCTIKRKEIRIIVTYDSFRLVREVLGKSISEYQIVVDEFQSIFTDSRFKVDTELELIHQLRDIQKVCFLSATPMMDRYLDMLDEFKDLPYYELDWESNDEGRMIHPSLEIKQCTSIIQEAKNEIQTYLEGKFERYSYRDKNGDIQEIYSKELVIYVNSVRNICDIIRKCGLTNDNTNILCAKTSENEKKIRKALGLKRGEEGGIGTVPQKGEQHKMFTLCTRTVYLGADFYSTNARSLILSDTNIDCLAVDISLDLPQILGRQRLDENPWKNSAMFRFKTNMKIISGEEFKEMVETKLKKTQDLLSAWEESREELKFALAESYIDSQSSMKYTKTYISVNKHGGSKLLPCLNSLVMISELRSFEIQQIDYADRFSVIREITKSIGKIDSTEVSKFFEEFNKISRSSERLKFLCEFLKDHPEYKEEIFISVPLSMKNYYTVLGPEKCKGWGYQLNRLEQEYQKQLNNQNVNKSDIILLLEDIFVINQKYIKSDIKLKLQEIYNKVGLIKVAKASDLENWYEVRPCKITNPETKKRDMGFELISKK